MKCLVVGQGIAGTVLAWSLLKRGVDVRIADAGFPHQSSGVAAGIINPVTGKRFVKSWRFDDFFPVARSVYQQMETELGRPFWNEQSILRLLESPSEINDWSLRMASPEYAAFIGERKNAGAWSSLLQKGFYIAEIRRAARVDFPVLLAAFRKQAEHQERLWFREIHGTEAELEAEQFDFIVFCEGYRGTHNPYFKELTWQLAKGEGLLFRLKESPPKFPEEMVKRSLMIAPLGQGLFWAGGSYNWTFDDNGPSDAEQQYVEARLNGMLNAPYVVVQRFGAIRPTVKDRRPFLGRSRTNPKMVIFNGLGTKGALLAPYWAAHLTAHLLDGNPLDPEVDVQRF